MSHVSIDLEDNEWDLIIEALLSSQNSYIEMSNSKLKAFSDPDKRKFLHTAESLQHLRRLIEDTVWS
jgi:hypothetical protein